MQQRIKRISLISMLFISLIATGCTTYGRGTNQVEVTEASENQSLNLLKQMNQLEKENTELKNQVEVGQYELDQINRRVQAQQAELDRLYQQSGLGNYTYSGGQAPQGNQGQGSGSIGQYPASSNEGTYQANTEEVLVGGDGQATATQAPAASGGTQTTVPQVASTESAQAIYNQGFEQLKQGRYPESIQSFAILLQQNPSSPFADDAQYWTGEAYYVNREFDKALQAFKKVNDNYPNSDRAADAKLKIGYIYYEQGDVNNARSAFEDIIARYPNERVSDFARERLKNISN